MTQEASRRKEEAFKQMEQLRQMYQVNFNQSEVKYDAVNYTSIDQTVEKPIYVDLKDDLEPDPGSGTDPHQGHNNFPVLPWCNTTETGTVYKVCLV